MKAYVTSHPIDSEARAEPKVAIVVPPLILSHPEAGRLLSRPFCCSPGGPPVGLRGGPVRSRGTPCLPGLGSQARGRCREFGEYLPIPMCRVRVFFSNAVSGRSVSMHRTPHCYGSPKDITHVGDCTHYAAQVNDRSRVREKKIVHAPGY